MDMRQGVALVASAGLGRRVGGGAREGSPSRTGGRPCEAIEKG